MTPRSHRAKLLAALLTLSLPIAHARSAHAGGAADEALAETLFTSGKALMGEQRYDEACEKFDASRRLSPGIGVTLWLAECHEQAARLATAWLYFREAAESARTRGDDRAALAETRARKLEPRLTRLRVVAGDFRGDVYRDGVKLPDVAMGEATPIDPGRYHFRFVDAAGAARELTVDAKERGRTYEIRAADATAVDGPARAPRSPTASVVFDEERTPTGGRPAVSHTLGWILVGAAAVGAGVGAGFGLDAAAKRDRSNDGHCTGNLCDRAGVDLRERAFDSAAVSTVAFAVGAAALTAGVLVLLDVFGRAPAGPRGASRAKVSLAW